MKLVESILTKNPCYTAGKTIEVKGLMLHSVGCPQPKASAFLNSWNQESYNKACVHAFIDGNDGTVYQTLPWNHRGWHCAKGVNGSGNDTHIGVEMCEPSTIKYVGGATFTCSDVENAKAVAERTYKVAVKLFAYLCKKYKLEPLKDGVIISHAEGYKRGIASNHGDPEHLWRQLEMGYTMDGFRRDVSLEMGKEVEKEEQFYRVRKRWSDSASQIGAFTELKYAKAMADKNPGFVVFDWNGVSIYAKADASQITDRDCPFKVKVNIKDLNIRKGAGTDTEKTGKCTGIGSFTIVEVRSGVGSVAGWGKLLSGAGWISLDFCERI